MIIDLVYNHAMIEQFSFDLEAEDGKARAGIFHTPHGPIHTPVFAPVGTQASVKGLTPDQLDISQDTVTAGEYVSSLSKAG